MVQAEAVVEMVAEATAEAVAKANARRLVLARSRLNLRPLPISFLSEYPQSGPYRRPQRPRLA